MAVSVNLGIFSREQRRGIEISAELVLLPRAIPVRLTGDLPRLTIWFEIQRSFGTSLSIRDQGPADILGAERCDVLVAWIVREIQDMQPGNIRSRHILSVTL